MRRALVVLLAVATVIPGVARAQVPGALLRDGALEIGVTYHELDRSLEAGGQEATWLGDVWAAALRLGVTETTTASVELSGGAEIYDEGGVQYLVGASIQTRMWVHGETRATTGISYARGMNVWRASGGCDVKTDRLDWNAQIEHSTSIKAQEVTLWAGPTLSYFKAQPQAPCNEITKDSSQIVGGIIGTSIAVERHVVISLQGLWVDSFESALLLAYRF